MKLLFVFFYCLFFLLASCVTKPPARLDNVCHIFKQYPKWYRSAKDVERRWRVPIAVQMAIIHQESKFDGRAKPKRQGGFWIIPGKRPSTAYGYSQALNGTWANYKQKNGGLLSSRTNFTDAVDFIGWYANVANRRAGIQRDNAYQLYLAYHEGVGGYMRKTYLKKPWLILVSRKVELRSKMYQAQLAQCHRR